MHTPFQALWADNTAHDPDQFEQIQVQVRDTRLEELHPGEVVLKALYSGINYKDALAVTGRGKILRQLPLIPGIDVAGVVVQSRSPLFREGDEVLINGCNLGEKYTGGFAQYVRIQAEAVLPRPPGLSLEETMILGTAGFTAALALHQLEKNGLRPDRLPVLITGATGGVGSCAVTFLNHLGYEVHALTRRPEHRDWLHSCGAAQVIQFDDLTTRPLESVVWAAAIDNLGGKTLSYILPRIDLWGSVTSIGLAQSAELQSTVFPFILRGVNLLGVSSNNCPQKLRQEIWQRIGADLKPENMTHLVHRKVSLAEIPAASSEIVNGKHLGRIVVDLWKS